MTTLERMLDELHRLRRALILDRLQAGDGQGVKHLVKWADIRVCCAPWLHRPYWYHAGGQRYVCEICERIAV